jgi:hypothetical protein
MESRLTVFGVTLFIVGILLLAFLLRRVFKRIRYQDTGDLRNKPPGGVNILLVLLALIFIILSQVSFWMSSQLTFFRPLNIDGDIGRVTATRTDDPVKSLEVRYVHASPDSVNIENLFHLSGDSWRISGEIIRFKFARDFLRLPEQCYKTVRFNAGYLAQRTPLSTGTLFHTKEIEGGSSNAFELFRDSKYLKWFAEVDSFAGDWVTVDGSGSYAVSVGVDGAVVVE